MQPCNMVSGVNEYTYVGHPWVLNDKSKLGCVIQNAKCVFNFHFYTYFVSCVNCSATR